MLMGQPSIVPRERETTYARLLSMSRMSAKFVK